MPKKWLSRRQADPVTLTIVLCWCAYFFAYWGRLNYSALMIDIMPSFGIDKAQAGQVGSYFYIAYGIGQLVSPSISKRFSARYTLFLSLGISAAMNILLPFSRNSGELRLIWLLNGAAQSMLWPGMMNLFATYIPQERLYKAIVAIHTTGAAGTLCVYLFSSLCTAVFTWSAAFFAAGGLLLAFAFLWFIMMGRIVPKLRQQVPPALTKPDGIAGQKGMLGILLASGTFVCILAAIANGALRDGTTLWAPTFIHENFGVSTSFSIFVTLFLPLFGLLGSYVARYLNRRITNPLYVIALCFGGSAGLIALLNLIGGISWMLACLLFALTICLMAAVNTIIVSVIPMTLRHLGDCAAWTGLFNFFCYVGSTASSYGLGALADGVGWGAMLWVLIACALCSGLVTAMAGRRYDRFTATHGIRSIQ